MQTITLKPERGTSLRSRMITMLLMVLFATSTAFAGPAEPYVPASDNAVLEHLPSTSDPRVRQFDELRKQAAAKPGDVKLAVALSSAYLNYGRDTGDARYLGRAQAVIYPWTLKQPATIEALLVEATILQSRHQFVESRQFLQAVLKRDPDNAQAWLTLASVALVQGDMVEARRDCGYLMGDMDALVTAGCIGSWSAVNGNAKISIQVIETLWKREPNEPPAMQSWAHGLLADAEKYLGDSARADTEFKAALHYAPGDNFLIADYADFLLDQNRAQEALELTRGYSQSDTSFLRQVLAEAALKLPTANADIQTMASRFRDLEQRGDSRLLGREDARFELELEHDPAKALKLAQDDWTIQHAPEDVRIYLQAAIAAGRPASAQVVLDFVHRTHLEDPKIRALAQQASSMINATAAVGARSVQ